MEVSVRTLQRNLVFMSLYKKEIANAKTSLRRYQWAAAEKGNVGMMIWLGKQYLQQREPITVINADLTDQHIGLLKQEALKLMQIYL